MKQINASVIAAALTARGYADTADGFRQYADVNFSRETPLNTVVRELDPQWEGDFGALTVANADDADDTLHDDVFALITGKDGDIPAGEFLNDAPQV